MREEVHDIIEYAFSEHYRLCLPQLNAILILISDVIQVLEIDFQQKVSLVSILLLKCKSTDDVKKHEFNQDLDCNVFEDILNFSVNC